MAFGDWDFYDNPAAINAALDITDPIVGAGSLALGNSSAAYNSGGGNITLDAGFTNGLEKGRIRTLVSPRHQWQSSTSTFINVKFAGIYCMADVVDISNGFGNDFYAAGITKARDTANSVRLIIGKQVGGNTANFAVGTDGSALQADLLVDTDALFTMNEDDILPIQFEWNLDIAQLGGIRLTLSAGNVNDTDFTNLATVYDLVDSSSPLISTAGEGLMFSDQCNSSGFSNQSPDHFAYDQTGVFQLV